MTNPSLTPDILRYASYICYAVAAILFITAIITFFTMKIKDVIYELSGKAKIASTQRMNDSYAVTGSLRISSTLTGSFETSGQISDNISKPTTSGLKTSGKIKQESGNIRKVNQTGKMKNGSAFKITKDIVVVHTNERIV